MTGNRVSPHTIYQQLDIDVEPPVLTPTQKHEVAENHVPFDVRKVEQGKQSENGEFLIFTVEAGQYRFKFFMSEPLSGNKPDDVVQKLTAEYNAIQSVTESGDVVGPYTLEYVEWNGGNPFYKLTALPVPMDALTANQEQLPF